VDRLKDMIAVGGFKVFPSQIEDILYHHPAIKEALVIGIADVYSGERPKAYVTLEAGQSASGEELLKWLNPQLGKHEKVIAVDIRDALPKTMIGKLDRKALRAEIAG
jgi:long-chain acyl-CoA synthetase